MEYVENGVQTGTVSTVQVTAMYAKSVMQDILQLVVSVRRILHAILKHIKLMEPQSNTTTTNTTTNTTTTNSTTN